MNDLIIYHPKLKLGHQYDVKYRLEIEDISKLNLNRYQCYDPKTPSEAKLHRKGLKTKCLTICMDELYNRKRCNCTQLKAFDANLKYQDCQYRSSSDENDDSIG